MDDLFLEHYILSLFTDDTQVTVRQLSLIAGGKRTPSVLFNVEKNRLYALYSLFPDLSLQEWERLVQSLVDKQFLKIQEDYLLIAPDGLKEKRRFLKDHFFKNDLDQLRYASAKKLFWDRFVFATQIFSEYSYQNKHYVPFLANLDNQLSLKRWLADQHTPMEKLAFQWFKELQTLFGSLPPESSDFIAGHFVGHDHSGSTSRQLKETYDLSDAHYKVLLDQLAYRLSQSEKGEQPLISSLFKRADEESDEGLSYSAWKTRRLLEKGHSIEAVAAVRKLKSNTIKEHILECVLVADWPYYSNYIKPAHYSVLHSLLKTAKVKTFSEAKAVIDDLDFFTYRLIEIERTRQNE